MKTSIYTAICLSALLSTSALAAKKIDANKLKCLADTGGANRIDLEIQQTLGSAPENTIDYNGHALSVGFYPGSPQESQQILVMNINGYQSKVYDPKKSLYVLESPNLVKIQCYIKTAEE